ncbi:hypothetical protein Sste5346_005876 [Sporothrix stenoceras]|uniref:C6 zinc finger domain containing protein n=1 Tax=Sporothrix stenoceras TaxID=5173 RepID=A0ABR3Z1A3_9PEZI
MAHQGSFSSAHSSVGSTSPASSTSAVSVSASPATVSFSVFQEGPGRPLVFAPPLGTPELQTLVDLFIALDVPVSMKMEMIQRDFEAHTARTNERYKTYFVPSASTPNAAPATITSPSTYAASPSPIFHNVFDAHFNHHHPASSAGSGSGSGSMYLDASPVPRPSPTGSDLTVASDSLFPLPVPMFPTHQFNDINAATFAAGNFFPVSAMDHSPVAMSAAASMWPAASLTATATPAARATESGARRSSQQSRQSAPVPSQRRRLSGSSSMQILTRTGEDVTHMSSRGTRTHEERENTRLVRQRGACPDCRRKKTRCNPDHAGFVAESVSSARSSGASAGSKARAGPYSAPAQSGRAKAEAAAAKAAKASKAKVEGKRAVTASEPVFVAPPQQAPSAAVLAGVEDGGGGGIGHIPPLDLSIFANSFDWDQLTSDQGPLFTDEDLELSIATTLSMTMPTTTNATTATASDSASGSSTTQDHTDSYSVPQFRPPPPHRPTDTARLQARRNLNVATTVSASDFASISATTSSPLDQAPQMGRMINAAADFNGFAGQAAFANDNSAIFGGAAGSTSASDNFFSTVNASMTGSCVQPGSSQTGGLTPASGLRTLRPLLARTEGEDLDRFDGDGDQGERKSREERERYRNVEDEERERDRPTSFTRRRHDMDPDHGRLMSFQDQGEQRWSTAGESSSRATRSRLQTETTSVIATKMPSTSTSSSLSLTSSLSPSDALMLLTVIVNFTASLFPAYQAWTAAARQAEEAHDSFDLASDLEVQFDRMNLGPALVSCQ